MAGSPRALTPPTCRRPRRCSRSCHNPPLKARVKLNLMPAF
jgi:hypothetical protein